MNIINWIKHWFRVKRYVKEIVKTMRKAPCAEKVTAKYHYGYIEIILQTVHSPNKHAYHYYLPYIDSYHLSILAGLTSTHFQNQIYQLKKGHLHFEFDNRATEAILKEYCDG